jgi:hypothetical protein
MLRVPNPLVEAGRLTGSAGSLPPTTTPSDEW